MMLVQIQFRCASLIGVLDVDRQPLPQHVLQQKDFSSTPCANHDKLGPFSPFKRRCCGISLNRMILPTHRVRLLEDFMSVPHSSLPISSTLSTFPVETTFSSMTRPGVDITP